MDNGIGMYGFFKAAKAYIVNDKSFGLIGCGCLVQTSNNKVTVFLRDGLKKRIMFMDKKLDIEAIKGEIQSVIFDRGNLTLELKVTDSTQLVNSAEISVKGLDQGDYQISYCKSRQILTYSGGLTFNVPIKEAGRIKIKKKVNSFLKGDW